MGLYFILLCFIAVQSAMSNASSGQTDLEADKARSAWNFGAHHPIKRSSYWNRPKNVAGPGSVIVNRRSGTISAQYNLHRRKPNSKRRQYKPYRPQVNYQQTNSQQPSYPTSGRSLSSHSSHTARMTYGRPRKSYRMRDPIRRRFMKEELWSLDKGETYALKEEDLDRDVIYRRRHYEKNAVDQDEIPEHHKKLATNAENMVNLAESNSTGSSSPPRIVHHHHYYEVKNPTPKPAQRPSQTPMHAIQTGVAPKPIPMPLPRIHNPIPLGCLLAVPVFHPIRPRHHLACLLSIPGTPNLLKKRRKRQAELPTITIMTPSATHTQSVLEQLFNGNSKYAPMMRKHYSNHVGNGKNPGAPPGPQAGNFKVPATIIAPPQFEKDDILNMLLGSGGVSVDKLGSVVSTNNRYVRYGRGLPNSKAAATPPVQSYRQGRHLSWMPENAKARPSAANNIQQIIEGSGSNHVAAVAKSPQRLVQHGRNPVVHLTPPPPQKSHYAPSQHSLPVHPNTKQSSSRTLPSPQRFPSSQQIQPLPPSPSMIQNPAQAPIILNLQISPVVQTPHHEHDHTEHAPVPASIPPQLPPPVGIEESPIEQELNEPIDVVTSSGKSHKLDVFKYTELVPVYIGKSKHNKPIKSYSSDSKDSKFYLRKLKPISPEEDEGSNDDELDNYDNSDDFQASPLIEPNREPFTDKINYAHDGPSYTDTPISSWQQDSANQVTDTVSGKTLSFAVKNNNFHDQLDSVLHEIASLEREASSSQSMYGNDVYENLHTSSSNVYYNPEKYYQASKVTDQEPDAILINVPKDISNEPYVKKK